MVLCCFALTTTVFYFFFYFAVSFVQIGPRGAIQLAGALRQNQSLTELDLRENSLGQTGMKAIADALASNDTMRTLHLQVRMVS